MSKKGAFVKIKNFVGKLMKKRNKQVDVVELTLPGLNIKMSRNILLDTPHEITVVVPRAEIRKICQNEDCSKFQCELIYSSITLVHAPRHPLAGPAACQSEDMRKSYQQ